MFVPVLTSAASLGTAGQFACGPADAQTLAHVRRQVRGLQTAVVELTQAVDAGEVIGLSSRRAALIADAAAQAHELIVRATAGSDVGDVAHTEKQATAVRT